MKVKEKIGVIPPLNKPMFQTEEHDDETFRIKYAAPCFK